MLRVITLCGVLGLSAGIAPAQDAGSAGAIEDVIQSQIDAFLADDFETAFTFASPMIKGIFGTPERFGSMVRNGYPMVWRPSDVQFLALEERGGRVHQKLMVRDSDGTLYMLDYEMLETPEGWQINGVQVLRAPELGA